MNTQTFSGRFAEINTRAMRMLLTVLLALGATGCNRSGEETDPQKNSNHSSGPATFANAKLNTADSVALLEISSLGQVHRQLFSFYDQFIAQDQTTEATLQQFMEIGKSAFGFNPRDLAGVEKASGINFSQPVSCSLRIRPQTEPGNPLAAPTIVIHVPISDAAKAHKLIGNLARLGGLTVKKETTAKPSIYSLSGKSGFSAEVRERAAYSIEDQVLTVLINDAVSSKSRYLAAQLLQAKAKPLHQVKHFQQALPYLAADNQLRLFLNIKSMVHQLVSPRTPGSALVSNFEAFGFTVGAQRLQAALTLANPAGIKKYLQPGASCQQLLATADKPLAAFSASLDNPLGLFDYLLQFTDPRWNREKAGLQEELGVSFDQLQSLASKGSGALLVYPAPGQPGGLAVMGLVKTTDRNLTQHLLLRIAEEGDFTAIKYGKNTVWRPSRSQRGPMVVFALLENHVVLGTAVSQIHNLVNKKGSGWKPSVGGTELVAGEVDLTGILQLLAAQQDFPDEMRSNLLRMLQKLAKQEIQLKLKATMQDDALVASLDLNGTTWTKSLATIAEVAVQGLLPSLNQSALNLPTFHPVQGRVTLDGKPLAGARVALHQVDREASRVFTATSDAQGKYQIQALYSTGKYPGAPRGKYKVTVIKVAAAELSEEEFDSKYQATVEATTEDGEPASLDDPAYLVSERYISTQTTPLEIEVREGRNAFNLELTSKPSPEN